jgi:hypothetical protein
LFGHGALNLNPITPHILSGVDAITTQLDSQDTLYDSQVDGNDVPVVDPNDMVSHSNSVEFTQSQQSIEGIEASRTAVDGFIDGEYADGVDDESKGLRTGPTGTPVVNVHEDVGNQDLQLIR